MIYQCLNHRSKIYRYGSLLQKYLSPSVASHHPVSCFSAKPHFPDPPSITPKASPPLPPFSLSSSSSPDQRPVFLSFRGEDTREGFVKSLHEALCLEGIRAFKDDVDLRKGCRIHPGLMDAIHHSWVFIPVISQNYASSKWCLEELAEIMKCVKMENKTVFPVFYDVRPTQVRHLTAPFSAAFAKLDHDSSRKVKTWKRALSEVANFSGFDLLGIYQMNEAKCIEDIVQEVGNKLEALKREKFTRIAAIEYYLAILNSLLRMESSKDDVLFVGILETDKSTAILMRTIFDKLSNHFEATYRILVSNSRKQEMVSLQKNFLEKISGKRNMNVMNVIQGMSMIKQNLCSKKALVILDGIGSIHQLRALAGSRDWYGPGSRIIVIATDKSVLKEYQMDETYKPTGGKCLISSIFEEIM